MSDESNGPGPSGPSYGSGQGPSFDPPYGPPAGPAQGPPPGAGGAQGPPYQPRPYGQPFGAPSPAADQAAPGGPPGGPPGPQRVGSRRPGRRRLAGLIAIAVIAGLVGGGAGAAATYTWADGQIDQAAGGDNALEQEPAAQQGPGGGEADVQEVAAKVRPSVVSITVRLPNGMEGGSGIILSANGRILTNNHVVEAAAQGATITVHLPNGKRTGADIVGRDQITDLAVIKADDVSGLKPATLGRSGALDVGEQVIAIGSPLGLSGTVTSGIVSALNRPVSTGRVRVGQEATSTVIDAIQTDAAINPGNSGGALVNAQGQVVGINTAIASLGQGQMGGSQSGSIGLGFAIPIDEARPIAKELVAHGRADHAQLGVSVSDASGNGARAAGAAIARVMDGGAADEAGLKAGDVVTKIGKRNINDADGLIAAVRSHRPGDSVTITYERDGQSGTATVTLGSDR